MNIRDGVLVIDKPEEVTSHDVVQAVRRHLGLRKVGHLGTLDPLATGVLPLAIGRATRLTQFLMSGDKLYRGTILLGYATDTFDRLGRAAAPSAVPSISPSRLQSTAQQMLGRQWQTPPAFSAKKVGGIRSYRLARRGVNVAIPPQLIQINRLELTQGQADKLDFEVDCSAGTYIRSLAHDLGKKLGCGAHLFSLRRLRSGEFQIDQSLALADLLGMSPAQLEEQIISIHDTLRHLPELFLDWPTSQVVARGGDFEWPADNTRTDTNTLYRMMSPDGRLLGLAEKLKAAVTCDLPDASSNCFHPRIVL